MDYEIVHEKLTIRPAACVNWDEVFVYEKLSFCLVTEKRTS